MFTIRENICFLMHSCLAPRKSKLLKLARNIAILLCVAILSEIFIFNYNFFATLNNRPIDLYNSISISKGYSSSSSESEAFRITSDNSVIEFHDLGYEANSILIDFPTWQNAQTFNLKLQYTDEAHLTYFDSTEYTAGIPEVTVSTAIDSTHYIKLNTAGKLSNLRIEIFSDGDHSIKYPIYLDTIELNPNRPFTFVWWRLLGLIGILLLVYAFRPSSAIYRVKIREADGATKAGMISTLAIEILLLSVFLFQGSNLVGVATNFYNYGDWDGKSIANTYEVGGDNAQQYALLAKAFANGHLYLDEEPPQWLKDMENPYDKGARDEAQKETGESYLFDVAFYQGHYYVYFGVVPVLIFYLPFYMLTGANFPTAIAVLFMVIAFICGITALLHRFAKYHFKRINLGIFLLCQIAIVTCAGILYLIKFPTFYSLPIASALAFSVWGLYFWMKGRRSSHRKLLFFIGSLCMALVVGCRPQIVLLSFLAFPLFWNAYITEKRLFTKDGMREFICLISPYVIVMLGLLIYNYARFGSLFDFGANYNLTVHDMTKRGLEIGRIAPAIFAYFLQTANLTGVFPYLQQVVFDTTYVGQTVREATFGGIFACLPILWILFMSKSALRVRNAQRKSKTTSGVILTLLISGVTIALLDAEVAGILQRYYADFSFMFLAAAVLIVFILAENAQGESSLENTNLIPASSLDTIQTLELRLSEKTLNKIIVTLVTLSVAYSVLLCFVAETGWYSDIYPWAYVGIIDAIQFWT